MKGSLSNQGFLRATLLVVLAMLVLATPASAARPVPPELNVSEWTSQTSDFYDYVLGASGVTWEGVPKARTAVLGFESCFEGSCWESPLVRVPVSSKTVQPILLQPDFSVGLLDGACTLRGFVRLLDGKGNVLIEVWGSWEGLADKCVS